MSITTTPNARKSIQSLIKQGVDIESCINNLAQMLNISVEDVRKISAECGHTSDKSAAETHDPRGFDQGVKLEKYRRMGHNSDHEEY